jgi:hypothetical protein
VDDAAREYIDAIAPEHRPHFDRLHGLILGAFPDAEVGFAYKMPTYAVGEYRIHVGVWKHGLSLYGWRSDRDGGLTARHPGLANDKGTLRLRPADLGVISDDELLALVRGALGG